MKRFIKWVAVAALTPVLLFLLLTILLYIPPVQDFAVRKASAYASEATGLDISVGRLRLRFPLDLDLQELLALDADGDTLVSAHSVVVDLDMTEILNQQVGVDAIRLSGVVADTKELIAAVRVAGRFDELSLNDDLDLRQQRVRIDGIRLSDADVDILVRDTVTAEDTTSSAIPWAIDVGSLEIRRSRVAVALEADSLQFGGDIERLLAEGGQIDLARNIYNVRACEGMLGLQIGGKSGKARIDTLTLSADSILFDGEAQRVDVGSFALRSPSSRIGGGTSIGLSAFEVGAADDMAAHIDADLSRTDLTTAAQFLGSEQLTRLLDYSPDVPLHLSISATGNIDSLDLKQAQVLLPGAVEADMKGVATHLTDSVARTASLDFNVRSGDLSWLMRYLDVDTRRVRLPQMMLAGTAKCTGPGYDIQARLDEGIGQALMRVHADIPSGVESMAYNAEADVRRIDVRHFLPRDSIGLVTAKVSARGSGTDLLARTTRLDAHATVAQLQYGRRFDLNGIDLNVHTADGKGHAQLVADNSLVALQADIYALLTHRVSDLTFGLDLTRADLYALGLTENPLSVAACVHLDGTTDLRDSHTIDASLGDIVVATADTIYRPADLTVQALLRADTVHAYVASGDLMVNIDTDNGYKRLLRQSSRLTTELQHQWQARHFDLARLRQELPMAQLHLLAGRDNPLFDLMAAREMDFEMVHADVFLSPVEGINGGGHLYSLKTSGLQLDTIAFQVFQDTTGIDLSARVHNGRRNPQFRFDALVEAHVCDTLTTARATYRDEKGRLGVDFGFEAGIRDESLQVHLTPLDPIIAYRTFHLNADNALSLHKRNRVEANIDLLADDGTGLKIYSTPNDDALQDLSVSINHLNLGELTTVLPYAPRLTGFLHGDAHLVQNDKNLSLSADFIADDLTLEGAAMGQLGVQAVYLPNSDGSHFIDGSLVQTGLPIATFSGTLGKATKGMSLDLDAELDRFPLSLANGFIPNGVAQLTGCLIGGVHVGGTTARPRVEGNVMTSNVRATSGLYSLDLRLADDTIAIADSRLTLDRLSFYTQGKTPFEVSGTVDFARTDRITIDATMSANGYELINARKTSQSIAYGRVLVDFNSQVRGTLDNLRVRGRLKVLGDTDVTYILEDSPLSAEDQLAGLVEFVDFSDTVRVEAVPEARRPQNLSITLSIQIDGAAHAHCLLNRDGSNYVDVEGGGDLMLTYTPEKDLQLTGRYTVNQGTLKYSMMVIPLKEFTIQRGSYVEFRGPVTNPYLSLKASERLRTTITENDQPRSVSFDVGLAISQTLENMGLEFTLEAPEDMGVQNELAAMSKEQRGRVAVTMLATGMYITDSGGLTSGGVSTQNAINAFLQSQISDIAGKALKSVDFSVGLEQGVSSSGSETTDYSFRFAKRFWGNRISVIVGGRVSTGQDATNSSESIIDNVSLEYRLDKSATRYVSLFYNRDNSSLFDGEVMKMGAGLVLRRKSDRLGELFIFRNKKTDQ